MKKVDNPPIGEKSGRMYKVNARIEGLAVPENERIKETRPSSSRQEAAVQHEEGDRNTAYLTKPNADIANDLGETEPPPARPADVVRTAEPDGLLFYTGALWFNRMMGPKLKSFILAIFSPVCNGGFGHQIM